MEEQIYIIGGVHGCYKTLLALIDKLPKDAKVCFVGDLCDRGKNSKDVIEFVKSNNYDCVIRNHEKMFIENAKEILKTDKIDEESSFWINKCGGQETLNSYDNDKELLIKHITFLETFPLYHEYKDSKIDNRYLVVSHSNVGEQWQYRNKDKESLDYKDFEKTILYSRFKNYDNKEIFNVFGHTPVEKIDVENKYKLNIDTGCVYHNGSSLKGYLSALEFPSLKVIKQENIEV